MKNNISNGKLLSVIANQIMNGNDLCTKLKILKTRDSQLINEVTAL